MDTIGARILAARTAAHLTQQALATKAATSVGIVSELERGVYRDPGAGLLVRLADALGVRVEALTGKHGEAVKATQSAPRPRRRRSKRVPVDLAVKGAA